MESVFDALKAMVKASSIEIAARTGKDRQQVVNELWDLRRAGLVGGRGTSWFILEQEKRTEIDLSDSEVEVVEMGSVKLDKAAEAESNRFSREKNSDEVSRDAEIIHSIPCFTDRVQNDVIIPAPRFISAEIRRTEAKLKRLQEMRDISREIHKHRKIWQQIRSE
ncbi:hypothetical protein VH79_25160 [Salmonella enterica]|uniref:DUF1627 domain-containing protein n=1 Tax=Salmonella enterica TaxID=28901 RepID=A0A5U3ILU3_SALER|nr:hypothetical protein [Salmonella enterica]